eukprot:111758-Chlamydomonas_euryale.AAC.4
MHVRPNSEEEAIKEEPQAQQFACLKACVYGRSVVYQASRRRRLRPRPYRQVYSVARKLGERGVGCHGEAARRPPAEVDGLLGRRFRPDATLGFEARSSVQDCAQRTRVEVVSGGTARGDMPHV